MATAATDVADLQVRIDVATELLRTELNRANQQIAQFATKADRSLDQVNNSFASIASRAGAVVGSLAGLAAGAGLGAFAGTVRQITQEMDDLSASAERVGLSAEQFQEVRFGLERLDVSADTASAALQRLLVATGAAAQGNAAAQATFARVGVSIQELATLNPGQVFDQVARGLGSIESPAERARIAAQLFGREAGAQLAAALADGGAALREWAQSARQSGQIVGEQTVKSLADANDAIDRFTARFNAARTQFLGDTIRLTEERFKVFRDGRIVDGLFFTDDDLRDSLQRRFARGVAEINRLNQQFSNTALDPRVREAARQRILKVADDINLSPAARPSARSAPTFSDIGGGSAGVEGATVKVRDLRSEVQKAQDEIARLLVGVNTTPVRPDIVGIAGPVRLPDAGERAQESLRNPPDISSDPSFQASKKVLDDIGAASEAARERATAFTDALSQGLAEAIVNGGNFGEVLKRIALQLLVIEPLTAAIRGVLGGGGAGGAAGAGAKGFLSSLFGGFFAEGGVPPLGKVSVVGERGPEFIVPRSPVEVVTAAQMARRLGGGGGSGGTIINQTLNFNTDRDSVRNQIQQAAPLIAAQSALAVGRAQRNTGIARK